MSINSNNGQGPSVNRSQGQLSLLANNQVTNSSISSKPSILDLYQNLPDDATKLQLISEIMKLVSQAIQVGETFSVRNTSHTGTLNLIKSSNSYSFTQSDIDEVGIVATDLHRRSNDSDLPDKIVSDVEQVVLDYAINNLPLIINSINKNFSFYLITPDLQIPIVIDKNNIPHLLGLLGNGAAQTIGTVFYKLLFNSYDSQSDYLTNIKNFLLNSGAQIVQTQIITSQNGLKKELWNKIGCKTYNMQSLLKFYNSIQHQPNLLFISNEFRICEDKDKDSFLFLIDNPNDLQTNIGLVATHNQKAMPYTISSDVLLSSYVGKINIEGYKFGDFPTKSTPAFLCTADYQFPSYETETLNIPVDIKSAISCISKNSLNNFRNNDNSGLLIELYKLCILFKIYNGDNTLFWNLFIEKYYKDNNQVFQNNSLFKIIELYVNQKLHLSCGNNSFDISLFGELRIYDSNHTLITSKDYLEQLENEFIEKKVSDKIDFSLEDFLKRFKYDISIIIKNKLVFLTDQQKLLDFLDVIKDYCSLINTIKIVEEECKEILRLLKNNSIINAYLEDNQIDLILSKGEIRHFITEDNSPRDYIDIIQHIVKGDKIDDDIALGFAEYILSLLEKSDEHNKKLKP